MVAEAVPTVLAWTPRHPIQEFVCSLFSLLHLSFLALRSEVVGVFTSVFKNACGWEMGNEGKGELTCMKAPYCARVLAIISLLRRHLHKR